MTSFGKIVRLLAAIVPCATALGAPGLAAPYPSAPYTTVGGAAPVRYCRTGADTGTTIDLEAVGCVSGQGPSAYPDPVNGLYTNWDGHYVSSYKDTNVEQAIMLATGEAVDLTLYRENVGSSSGNGIQVWVDNGTGQRQITWAFEQSLINSIQAGTISIGYLTIKASDSYVVYKIPTGVFSGRYSTEGILTGGGSQPQVSHVRFWKEIDYNTVAEPGAFALLGLGFVALGLRRRSR